MGRFNESANRIREKERKEAEKEAKHATIWFGLIYGIGGLCSYFVVEVIAAVFFGGRFPTLSDVWKGIGYAWLAGMAWWLFNRLNYTHEMRSTRLVRIELKLNYLIRSQRERERKNMAKKEPDSEPEEVSTEEFFESWKAGTLDETLLKAAKMAEEQEQQKAAPEEPSFGKRLKSGEPFTQNGVTFTPHSDSGPVSWGGWPKDPEKK